MAKVRENWLIAVFKKLAETEYLEEDIDAPEYSESSYLAGVKEEVSTSIQDENNKTSKNGRKSSGLKKKYETPTIEVKDMSSEKLKEMREKLEQGREKE